jgi:hypothetical protein
LFTHFLQAQAYQPLLVDGRTWDTYVSSSFCFYNPCYGWQYLVDGDTIISNLTYKKIYAKAFTSNDTSGFLIPPLEVNANGSLVSFMREDIFEQKVYTRLSDEFNSDTSEYLVYDFALKIGDTLNLAYLDSVDAVVDTILFEMITDGTFRRKIIFEPNNTLNYSDDYMHYIEGVGGTGELPFPFTYVFEVAAYTTCIKENGRELYDFTGGEGSTYSCDAVTSTQKRLAADLISIFPNPVQDYLTIQSDQRLNTKLYNLSGSLLTEARLTVGDNLISLKNLPTGIYFLALYDKSGYVGTRKIFKN